MKRSEINRAIEDAKALFDRLGFKLPPFARWTPDQWDQTGPEADEIRSRRLGWDVTDFGSGRFRDVGLTLFTVRNGKLDDPANRKTYAEKIMMSYPGQVTPWHFHWMKTEDIINRGGGALVVELHNADARDAFASSPVRVSCDGVVREVPAGGAIQLHPGDSVTLVPRVYHRFFADPRFDAVMIGEVSSVNDDATDNRFHEPLPRFPSVDEDAPPGHFLCGEYPSKKPQ